MEQFTHYIEVFGYFGYLILFVTIFLESFPLTFFFPGDSLLFVTGFLAYLGHFNIGILVSVYFFASICGYLFSYYVGQKLRDMVLSKKKFLWIKPHHIDKTQTFYEKYGMRTVVIGRFVPIIRSFSPVLAGAADMDRKKFFRYTVIGAILWGGGLPMVGFYLGQIFPNAHVYLTPIILFVILVSLLPFITGHLTKNKKSV